MVLPIIGFPAGQSVEKDGIVVTLTYFNRRLESALPDGTAIFMLVNLGDEAQTVTIDLALAFQGSDHFRGSFRFKEVVAPRSVVWRSHQSDSIKTATLGGQGEVVAMKSRKMLPFTLRTFEPVRR